MSLVVKETITHRLSIHLLIQRSCRNNLTAEQG